MQCLNITNIPEKKLQLYRNILGNTYNNTKDEDIILLANRINGFCHAIINSYLKDFSEKKENQLLFLQSEEHG